MDHKLGFACVVAALLFTSCSGDQARLVAGDAARSPVGSAASDQTVSAASPADAEPNAGGSEQPEMTDDQSRAALDEIVRQEQEAVPEMLEQADGTFSDIEFAAEGSDTLVITYVYAFQMDQERTRLEFERNEETFKQVAEMRFELMRYEGVGPVQRVKYIYRQSDGKEILTWSYASTDV